MNKLYFIMLTISETLCLYFIVDKFLISMDGQHKLQQKCVQKRKAKKKIWITYNYFVKNSLHAGCDVHISW